MVFSNKKTCTIQLRITCRRKLMINNLAKEKKKLGWCQRKRIPCDCSTNCATDL